MAIRDATIAVDFDGTVVTHAYPQIGDGMRAPAPVLRELIGQRLPADPLHDAAAGDCSDRRRGMVRPSGGIPLYAVNENSVAASAGPRRRRFIADLYIDDSALGCPIKFEDGIKRPFVNWVKVRQRLVEEGFLD